MRSLTLSAKAYQSYEELRKNNPAAHRNLQKIIKEMLRGNPAKGFGKPEPLKHNLSGYWSRRISKSDRVIYKFTDAELFVIAIGGHYEQFS